jgi:DNA (cytosine-5)-methyltransferase 1
MFTGIGGFEKGIEQAYGLFDNEHAHIGKESEPQERTQGREWPVSQPGVLLHNRDGAAPLCIGYSEIDKYAINTYEGHYEHRNYGDATAIDANGLPDFELLVGGFPCQAFSIAGKRRGFDDTRGTLFFDVARILKHKRPRHLVLENVKGLLSHEQGETFQTILGVLADLGYRVEYMVLNSKNFGVPQNRERVYIVGHLRGECGGQIFPLGESGSRDIQAPGGTQGEGQWLRGNDISSTVNTRFGSTARGQQLVAKTLAVRDYKGGNNLVALTETRTEEAKAIRRESQKQGRDFSPRRGKVLTPRNDEVGNTVTAAQSKEHYLTDGVKIRRLTPTECERLQGFPDGWTLGSDTQRYKQCGNAVTVNTVEAVMTALIQEGCLDGVAGQLATDLLQGDDLVEIAP